MLIQQGRDLHVAAVPGLPRYAVSLASVNCARAGHKRLWMIHHVRIDER